MVSKSMVKKVLQKAKGRLSEGWCKNNYAMDKANDPVDAPRKTAVKFCMVGAIDSVTNSDALRQEAKRILASSLKLQDYGSPWDDITEFNDAERTRKATVIRAIDRAIKAVDA